MYLTYLEYQEMGGTLDESAFLDLEFQARSQIDWYTFNRLRNEVVYPEEVKRCIYRLISILNGLNDVTGINGNADENNSNKAIVSQSNDGVSISYNVLSAQDTVQNLKEQCIETINKYLHGVVNSLGQKVLYRGVYPNE